MSQIERKATPGLQAALIQRARRHEQALKYLVIGGAATVMDAVLFMILFNFAAFTEWQAHSVSMPVSSLFSFVVNARHNFRTSDHILLRLASYSVVCVIGFFVGYGVIEAARSVGIDSNAGKIVSLPVAALLQYVLNSRITFRKSKREARLGGTT
jgi:putative flippase GtrA